MIAAFQANVPFDRFTILQLAGDLVEPLPGEHPDDRVLAAAYNRLLQTTHEGGLQVKEHRAIYQADRIRNVSGTWLDATVGCAQCHDPYNARDFYALGSFFADIGPPWPAGSSGRSPKAAWANSPRGSRLIVSGRCSSGRLDGDRPRRAQPPRSDREILIDMNTTLTREGLPVPIETALLASAARRAKAQPARIERRPGMAGASVRRDGTGNPEPRAGLKVTHA